MNDNKGYKNILILAREGMVYITNAPRNVKRSALVEMARVELKTPELSDIHYFINPNYYDIDQDHTTTIEY